MEKRGFAIAFSWIFAIIAGMVIFLFLMNFAYKHIFLSESKTQTVLLTNLESQLDSLSVAEFLDKEIDLNGQFEINFDCSSISTKSSKISTEKIIFSDKKIISNKLKLWTQNWKYPFDTANFYYITSKNFYLFDAPYDLYSKIPSRFNFLIPPDPVPKDAVLIFFRQPSQSELERYKNNQIKIIKDNTIIFYPSQETGFFGDEMLIGAIFAEDYAQYNCLKDKALARLKIVSQVYKQKAETLSRVECQDKYFMIISLLSQFPINPVSIDNADKELERNACTPLFH